MNQRYPIGKLNISEFITKDDINSWIDDLEMPLPIYMKL